MARRYPTADEAVMALNVITHDDGRETVHTNIDGGAMILGTDWPREDAEALVRDAAARELLIYTTGMALAMQYGLLAIDERNRRIFLETKPGWRPPEAGDGAD